MKRFDMDESGMLECANGDWIRYEDHVDAMKRIAGEGRADIPQNRGSTLPGDLVRILQDIGYEFGCPAGIKVTDWIRVRLAQPAHAIAAIRKVKESLDPADWCGDESMLDALERAESYISGGNGAGNGRVEVACVDRAQSVEVQGYSADGLASDVVPCWEVSSASAQQAGDELDLNQLREDTKRPNAMFSAGIVLRLLNRIAAPAPAASPVALTEDQIREVFLANGFTIKEGQTDLKPYVYAAARALLALAASPAALAVDWQHTLAEAREAVEERWEQSNTLHDHALLQRIDGLLAASPAKCDGTVSNCPNECSAPCSPSELPAMTDAQIETMLQIREHEPTIFIEDEILSNYDEMREEVWEAIKVYADIHARAALQQCRALLAAEKKCTRCEYIGHCDCEVTEGK